jgi:NTP pyrophosphatase (non-canonical NTP hydrolase)
MTWVFSDLNDMADHVYQIAKSKGFHDNDDDPGKFPQAIANLHEEVSELWVAYRSGSLDDPCDKWPKMKALEDELGDPFQAMTCAEEELADVIIRALDNAKMLDIDIATAVFRKSRYNESRPRLHGKVC